jgi:hypothetical protein
VPSFTVDRAATSALVAAAAEAAGVDRAPVGEFAARLLPSDYDLSHSTLNNNGLPIQVCVSCSPNQRSVRLIGDPAAHIGDPYDRMTAACEVAHSLAAERTSPAFVSLADALLEVALPSDGRAIEELPSGCLWVAGGVEPEGLAIYAAGRWGTPDSRWRRAWAITDLAHSRTRPVAELLTRASGIGRLASVAVEGTDGNDARIKLYWRLARPVRLSQVGVPFLRCTNVVEFLELVLSDRAVSLSGMVLSVGIAARTGKVVDAKIDLCAHCLSMSTEQWVRIIRRATAIFGLTEPRIIPALERCLCQVALIGIGVDDQGALRLNVYLNA